MFGVVFWKLVSELVVVIAVVCAYFYMGLNGLLSMVNPDMADDLNRKIDKWLDEENKE